ncbi:hypothetical protein PSTT_14564 [Puccinia striiformis]|uniref:Uncharacterized protein n=1 Tax=Puccinia striiformis TaxID=27350 RepID=A0A2S4UM08_9BASI|nr:hypothetical protein PSTT_14564 [Puccinia striiformis]
MGHIINTSENLPHIHTLYSHIISAKLQKHKKPSAIRKRMAINDPLSVSSAPGIRHVASNESIQLRHHLSDHRENSNMTVRPQLPHYPSSSYIPPPTTFGNWEQSQLCDQTASPASQLTPPIALSSHKAIERAGVFGQAPGASFPQVTKLHNFQPHQQHSHLSNSSTTFSPFNFINITSRFQTGDGLFSEARGQQNVAITSDMRRLICAAIDFWVRTSLPSPFSQIPRTLVPGPSVTTANGQLSAHGADDLLTNHRFSEDDLKIQEYKANFPQLHIPPIRQPKTARKQFDSLEQKTSEKNVLQLDFQSIRNELDTLKDELKEQIEYLLDKNPVENMGDTKALIQKLEELKIIHTKLLRDTIRAKVTELCAMHPHHTMIEITEMAGLPYTLDDIKQLVLESHMKDLHVLLHQVGSFQSKDGDRVLNWIASQLQDFIFKTVEFLYKYDMIPMSMVRIFFSMDKTLEVAVYTMLESIAGTRGYVNDKFEFWRSNFVLEYTSVSHFWNLFHALEVIEQRRFSWLSDQFLLRKYFPSCLELDEDIPKLIFAEDNSFLAKLESHVEILSRNKATRSSEKSPHLHTISETIGFLLEKSLTVTHAHTLKIISTVLDFIMKNYQDYDVMEFNKRGSPTKEAFDLRYASLDLIEELVRIDKYLHGFYHYQYNDNGEDDLILTLNGKTTSEIASQVGLIDSYIQITYKKHKNLIERLWETNPIFHGYDQLEQIHHRLWRAEDSIECLEYGLREATSG